MALRGCGRGRMCCPGSWRSLRALRSAQQRFAGHSKWHNIRHKKAANDAKRMAMLSKVAKEVSVASRLAAGDMSNPRLTMAIDRAKAANMAKGSIQQAIDRGMPGSKEMGNMEELMYEGTLGTCALLVRAQTDNRNRTAAAVRHHFSKCGGSMGGIGSVNWMFDRVGFIEVRARSSGGSDAAARNATEDEVQEWLLDACVETGADEFRLGLEQAAPQGGLEGTLLVTDQKELMRAHGASLEAGLEVLFYGYRDVPKEDNCVTISTEASEILQQLLDLLENDTDVSEVAHNVLGVDE
uniref:Transcriptional regulatory protein n=1 Tax=Pinguiococcus pyrenoidosus TaxID=172671 RepID=A0A7R9U6K9_9STRA